MGYETGISWAHSTFNIAIGCEKISEACANCYAERQMSNPFFGGRYPNAWATPARTRYALSAGYWRQPIAWNKSAAATGQRRRVFASSLCDIFEKHPLIDHERGHLFELIEKTQWLDWLLLTKRIDRAAEVWPWKYGAPPKNIWLGATTENDRRANERLPILLGINAYLRFISAEPLLSTINLQYASFNGADSFESIEGLHWVIAGGESGPYARRTYSRDVYSLLYQCQKNSIPFHFKQWGEFNQQGVRVGKKAAGREIDGKVYDEVPQPIAA